MSQDWIRKNWLVYSLYLVGGGYAIVSVVATFVTIAHPEHLWFYALVCFALAKLLNRTEPRP